MLQAAILESVSRAAARTTLADGLTVTITVRDVAPTRPTRQQSADDPALDVMQTRYLGGAALVGEVRDARQQLVATVRHRYFSPAIREAALSPDPWGDARLAIEQFTARLIKACRKLRALGALSAVAGRLVRAVRIVGMHRRHPRRVRGQTHRSRPPRRWRCPADWTAASRSCRQATPAAARSTVRVCGAADMLSATTMAAPSSATRA